jgi:hypothetical protein
MLLWNTDIPKNKHKYNLPININMLLNGRPCIKKGWGREGKDDSAVLYS